MNRGTDRPNNSFAQARCNVQLCCNLLYSPVFACCMSIERYLCILNPSPSW